MHLAAMRPALLAVLLLTLGSTTSFADCGTPECVAGDCCAADCTFQPTGTVCRPAAGECDVAETCDGTSSACPADVVKPSGTDCTDEGNVCTIDQCDGVDVTCQHLPGNAGIVCRPTVGPCDVAAERCDGVSSDCPPDTFQPASMQCRASAGACDPAEFCTGTTGVCPPDVKTPAGTVCRAAAGDCDVAETCDGTSAVCAVDAFAPPSVVCRGAAGECDAPETCTGSTVACPPDLPMPTGTPCSDGTACTRTDVCVAGVCTGTNRVVCSALDACHLAGVCDPLTGVCSNPEKPDNVPCNDGNACTTADSCQSGVCRGLAIAGCCLTDADCDDGIDCTDDRCAGHGCVHTPNDGLCSATECAQLACVPSDPSAGADGCVARAAGESAYCSEDGDPCTIDACRGGRCQHDSDGSGPGCPALGAPYRALLRLLQGARDLDTAIQSALAGACSALGPGCDVTPGPDPTRLAALLGQTEGDLAMAGLALSGRLAGSPSPDVQRDPTVRGRLALGLLAATPDELRAFLATLAQARASRVVAPTFARARRADARALLRGTNKVKRQLQRLVTRRQSFAR